MKNANALVSTTGTTNFIRRKIGNTVYRVSVSFSDTSREHIEDKILRLIENDNISKNCLNFDDKSDILSVPQTGLLLEGGSF